MFVEERVLGRRLSAPENTRELFWEEGETVNYRVFAI